MIETSRRNLAQARWLGQRAIETLRHESLRVFVLRAARMVLSPLGELLVFAYYRHDLGDPVELHDAKIDISIGPLPIDQLDELVSVVWESYHPARQQLEGSADTVTALIRARYDTGATCFVARRDGRIVHYNWVFEQVFEARRPDQPALPR